MDKFTIRNLELVSSTNEGGISLLSILDKTAIMILKDAQTMVVASIEGQDAINQRLNVVNHFVEHYSAVGELSKMLSQIGDLERMVSRLAALKIIQENFLNYFSLKSIHQLNSITGFKFTSLEELSKLIDDVN